MAWVKDEAAAEALVERLEESVQAQPRVALALRVGVAEPLDRRDGPSSFLRTPQLGAA